MRQELAAVVVAGLAACRSYSGPPSLSAVQVEPNPLNPLSVAITFQSAGAACASVSYSAPEDPPMATPCEPVRDGAGRMVVLGLLEGTAYSGALEVWKADGQMSSQPVSFTSGSVPDALSQAHLEVTGDEPDGYLLTTLGGTSGYAVAFDGAGRLRWLRAFGETIGETKQQANGDFTTFVGSSHGFDPVFGHFSQYAPSGEEVATWSVAPPLHTDDHELTLSLDASGKVSFASYFAYSISNILRPDINQREPLAIHSLVRHFVGGGKAKAVYGSSGRVSPSDTIEGPGLDAMPDIDHPNSIDFDTDGNYVVSFRNLGEVDKIDAASGAFLWRLGGTHSRFVIAGDPEGGFSAQHSARMLGNGNLILYDNGWRHSPPQTRVVEYRLDLHEWTATMVWQYTAGYFTQYTGSVQRLQSGETLVGWANGVVQRVDAGGNLLYEARVMADATTQAAPYRTLRIPSLYEYRKP